MRARLQPTATEGETVEARAGRLALGELVEIVQANDSRHRHVFLCDGLKLLRDRIRALRQNRSDQRERRSFSILGLMVMRMRISADAHEVEIGRKFLIDAGAGLRR